MAQLIVRNLEDNVKRKIANRALRHGRSMEQEVRDILRSATQTNATPESAAGSIAHPQQVGTRAEPTRIRRAGAVPSNAPPEERNFGPWQDFFELMRTVEAPDDFLTERPMNTLLISRNIFDEEP